MKLNTSHLAYVYIYVWKLNQTVLELYLRAVKFLFFPRRDLNSHHWYTAAPFALPYAQRPRPLDHIHSLYINYTLYKNPGFWLVNCRCIFRVFSYLGSISFIFAVAGVFAILYPELSFLLRYTTSLSTLILQDFCKI